MRHEKDEEEEGGGRSVAILAQVGTIAPWLQLGSSQGADRALSAHSVPSYHSETVWALAHTLHLLLFVVGVCQWQASDEC